MTEPKPLWYNRSMNYAITDYEYSTEFSSRIKYLYSIGASPELIFELTGIPPWISKEYKEDK